MPCSRPSAVRGRGLGWRPGGAVCASRNYTSSPNRPCRSSSSPQDRGSRAALFQETVPALQRLGPSFISVTYGAGGSTRDRTLRIVHRLRQECGIEAMSHLTCVGASRTMLREVLDQAGALGIENILALRGDPPRGQTEFRPAPDGLRFATDLVRLVKSHGSFAVGAAGYPEGHVECGDKHLDWDRTAAKVEAGAEFIITQLFYDAEDFLAFEDYLRHRRGVRVPIVPGILPFLSTEQIQRFTGLCGARLRRPAPPAGVLPRRRRIGPEAGSGSLLGPLPAAAGLRPRAFTSIV